MRCGKQNEGDTAPYYRIRGSAFHASSSSASYVGDMFLEIPRAKPSVCFDAARTSLVAFGLDASEADRICDQPLPVDGDSEPPALP